MKETQGADRFMMRGEEETKGEWAFRAIDQGLGLCGSSQRQRQSRAHGESCEIRIHRILPFFEPKPLRAGGAIVRPLDGAPLAARRHRLSKL